MSAQNGEQVPTQEPAEDAWERVTEALGELADQQLWAQLADFAHYRGGDAEQNLILAGLVHTLAARDQQAADAFERWKEGPADGRASGHIVPWMLQATGRR